MAGTAVLQDMSIIASDTTFGKRVLASLTQYIITTLSSEAVGTTANACQTHISRKNYGAAVLNSPSSFQSLFVNAAASNQVLANDVVTTAGTSLANLTGAQVATAITPVNSTTTGATDTDINNSVANAFNSFIAGI